MGDALRTSAGDERLGWLDSLRGGAALAIATFHATVFLYLNAADSALASGLGSGREVFWSTVLLPARYGYVGFSMFFLVSGFAIHYPIALGAVPFDFRTFIARRFVRLYVPYLAALAFGLGLVTFVRLEPPIDIGEVVKAIFFVSNYPHPGGPYYEIFHQQPQQNFVIWTVSIEFELYFFYPLLLRSFAKFGPVVTLALVAGVSALMSSAAIFADPPPGLPPNWVSFLPAFTPFWVVWATGAALAEARARGRFPKWNALWMLATIVLGAIILVARPLGMPRLYEVLVMGAFCGALFVRASIEPAGRLQRAILEALRRLGRISYSYYLTQIPTFYLVGGLWFALTNHQNATPLPVLISILAAVPISFAFFTLVERPSTGLARTVAHRLADRMRETAAKTRSA